MPFEGKSYYDVTHGDGGNTFFTLCQLKLLILGLRTQNLEHTNVFIEPFVL